MRQKLHDLSLALLLATTGMSLLLVGAPQPSESQNTRVAQIQQLIQERMQLRAYDGAPPVIPHETEGMEQCNSCHAATAADSIAPARPHAVEGECRVCHVARATDKLYQTNNFQGLWWPPAGSRLTVKAPPTVPHHVQNRENCSNCHVGEQAPEAIRARHGERPACLTCHAPTVSFDKAERTF